jgi:hypothetical protein
MQKIFMEKSVKSNYMLIGLMLAASLITSNGYAAKVVLNFEGIGDLAAVNDFYNFGVDSAGNTGTDYGVSFSNSAFGIIDADIDPLNFHGNFSNAPSASTALIFLEGGTAIMNVKTGFDSSLSLSYSSSANATVKIYDGLDGTGNLLASLNLVTNFENNCNFTSDAFCHWDPIGVTFKGKAKSVVFEGPRTNTFYDDITLGIDEKNNCKKTRKNRHGDDDHPGIFKCDQMEHIGYSRWHRNNRYSKCHN